MLEVLIGAAILVAGLWLVTFFFGPQFVPSESEQIETMFALAEPEPGNLWIDFGSGDGRVLMSAASRGVSCIGYELNPLLVLMSRVAIRYERLQNLAKVSFGSVWSADLSQADVISVYFHERWMKRVEDTLAAAKLKPTCRIVVSGPPLPNWTPVARKGQVSLYHPLRTEKSSGRFEDRKAG